MLSPKHRRLLDFITAFQHQKGFTPTCAEMAAGLGLKSRSGVVPLIKTLGERGFIRHAKHKERDIEVLVKDGVMVPPRMPPGLALSDQVSRKYLCSAGTSVSPLQVLDRSMLDEVTEALYHKRRSDKPYTMEVIVRLTELGGQG